MFPRTQGNSAYVSTYEPESPDVPSQDEQVPEAVRDLMDIEVSLKLDGYPQLVGPGSTSDYFNEEAKRDILEGHDTYYEGDQWLRLSYKDFTAIC